MKEPIRSCHANDDAFFVQRVIANFQTDMDNTIFAKTLGEFFIKMMYCIKK